jgi:competence protein ComEA
MKTLVSLLIMLSLVTVCTAAGNNGFTVKKSLPTELVNINTADTTQLMTLPGIGSVLAQRIVDYRSLNGDFQAVEDLMLVKGIKVAKFDKIKSFITVSETK